MEVWKKGRTNQKTRYRERNPKRTPVRGATGEQVALRENGRKPSNPLLVKNLTSILRTAVEKLLAAKSHFSLLQVTGDSESSVRSGYRTQSCESD